MNLTLNTYTQWYWKTDLHNLLHFLSLRADAHAQYEIRVYAEAMLATVEAWVPACHAAFRDYRLGAATLSAGMLAVVRRMLAGEEVRAAGQRPVEARMAGADGDAGPVRWRDPGPRRASLDFLDARRPAEAGEPRGRVVLADGGTRRENCGRALLESGAGRPAAARRGGRADRSGTGAVHGRGA